MGAGCSGLTPVEKESAWYFRVAVPKHYDVWVQYMEFELSGEYAWHQAPGFVSCCWRGDHGPRGPGGRLDPFPNYIAIQWFSYAEQKFYQRLMSIPEAWLEKMKEPAPYTTSLGAFEGPRDSLIFGLAPGGEIVVWVMNQIGNEIELARLQANEIEGDPSEFKQTTEGYLERSGDHLEEHGIPKEGW
ncbi:DUF2931 family protein [Marinobacter sp.]|uniref:DUF2931 family protein n=1 Tax=Marinobacter sp. TaxID=50741 RepID=UPI0034A39FE7